MKTCLTPDMEKLMTHKKTVAEITRNHSFTPEYSPMPDYTMFPKLVQEQARMYRESMMSRGYSVSYVRIQMYQLRSCLRYLMDANLETDPMKIGMDELHYLREVALKDLAVTSIHAYILSVEKYVRFHSDRELPFMIFPDTSLIDDSRWLTSEQARRLMTLDMDVMSKTYLVLTLGMGLRKCEVIRLTVDNISDTCIYVRGKGTGGGKYRAVPYCAGARDQLMLAVEYRQKIIDRKLKICPTSEIPPNLFLADDNNHPEIHPFLELGGGFDARFVKKISKIAGYEITNHMLRRTFARQLWCSGVDLLIIASILGHNETTTTKKYIGINTNEMTIAMNTMDWSINACMSS